MIIFRNGWKLKCNEFYFPKLKGTSRYYYYLQRGKFLLNSPANAEVFRRRDFSPGQKSSNLLNPWWGIFLNLSFLFFVIPIM